MTEVFNQAPTRWVDIVDINSDGVNDTSSERSLKEVLKKDLQTLWTRKTEGRISELEYDRYISVAKAIFEKQGIELLKREQEYMNAKKKIFKKSNYFTENLSMEIESKGGFLNYASEKARNITSDIKETIIQEFDEKTHLRAYNHKEGNHTISIVDFEKELKYGPVEELNSLALKSYFIYLKKYEVLTRENLEGKMGGKERFLQLAVLWGISIREKVHATELEGDYVGKLVTTMKAWRNGITEQSLENGIFKDVIFDNIKNTGLERKFLNKEAGVIEYNDIIKQMEQEFNGLKVTGDMVRKYFQKALQNGEKRLKKMEQERNKVPHDFSVESFLKICQVTGDMFTNTFAEKKIDRLTEKERKYFLNILRSVDISRLPKEIGQFLEQERAIQKQKDINYDIKESAGNKSLQEMTARNHNNSKTPQEIIQSLAPTMARIRLKGWLEAQNDEYKDILKQIGFTSIVELAQKSKLSQVFFRLKGGGSQQDKLYEILKQYQAEDEKLQKLEAREYIKARENKTEKELQSEEKKGRIIIGSADDLYNEDVKQHKTTDFTVPKMEQEQKYVNETKENNLKTKTRVLSAESDFSVSGFMKMVNRIPLGQQVPIDLKNDKLFVERNGTGFNVVTPFKTEYCTNPSEVGNYIDSRKFFHEIGCGFMAEDMDKILHTVHSRSAHIGESFMTKQGLSSEKKAAVMKAIAHTMQLPLVCDGIKEDELKQQFKGYCFTHTSDGSLHGVAQAREFISNGSFAIGRFLESIPLLS